MIMDDLYSSNIDDELFGDEPGGSNTGNPGQQDGNDGVKGNQGDNNNGNGGNEPPKTGGRGNDSEILDWFNSNQVKGVVDEDGGNSDVLSDYLRMKGIDPDNIQINDEQDNPSYSSFKDLGRQEQLDLLRSLDSTDDESDYDLDDDEIDLINSIRSSNMSIEEFVSDIQNRAVQDYVNSGMGNHQQYSVDQLSDQDLFVSDYKARMPNASDDEVISALNAAMSNQQSFENMMAGLRQAYKQQEEDYIENQIRASEERARRQQEGYENIIVDTLNNMGSIKLGKLQAELDEDDKYDIAGTILDSDTTGTRRLARLINDPETLVKMVWYATKGENAIDEMQRYYMNEINTRQKAAYQKGFEDAKNGKGMSYVVNRPARKGNQQPQFRSVARVEDIDAGMD